MTGVGLGETILICPEITKVKMYYTYMSVMTMNNCENENDIFPSVDMTDLPPDIKGACAMCIVHRLKGEKISYLA